MPFGLQLRPSASGTPNSLLVVGNHQKGHLNDCSDTTVVHMSCANTAFGETVFWL